MKNPASSSLARKLFFDRQVHMAVWKDSMSGKNEDEVIKLFEIWGYKLNQDYVRQHPIGERFVLDFAFVKERVAIEVDGKSHNSKRQKRIDRQKDSFLYRNGWVVIRIAEAKMKTNPLYYKYLIHEVVEERNKQYQGGFLHAVEVKTFNEQDY